MLNSLDLVLRSSDDSFGIRREEILWTLVIQKAVEPRKPECESPTVLRVTKDAQRKPYSRRREQTPRPCPRCGQGAAGCEASTEDKDQQREAWISERGRQLYGPDYKAKIVAPPAVEMTV
jgi:hypothetical protein